MQTKPKFSSLTEFRTQFTGWNANSSDKPPFFIRKRCYNIQYHLF
uniref:Uncharacterized protein n=1 Tax=Arundo donax TaxID=35708 RepID=A0A0A9BLP7_ARUDO